MGGYHKVITMQLPAAVANGITLVGAAVGAGDMSLNGGLVSGGIANLVVAQRVGIVSAGNDSGVTFTIYGTDRKGRTQNEPVTGKNADTAISKKDFLTVTRISRSGSAAGNVTIGTVGRGSSEPMIVDRFVNPAEYAAAVATNGVGTTYSIEESLDDMTPDWDMTTNDPTWFQSQGFASENGNQRGTIRGPLTMLRLTIEGGTDLVTATIVTPFKAGAVA